MMTRNEAVARAKAIWGSKARSLTLIEGDYWRVWLTDMTDHTMDPNGHTTCHNECAKLEARL